MTTPTVIPIDFDLDDANVSRQLDNIARRMENIGDATVTSRKRFESTEKPVKKLDTELGKVQKNSGGIRNKLGGAFTSLQKSIQGAAGKVPVFGGALSKLSGGPITLGVTAVAGLTAGVGALINKQKDAAVEIGNTARTLGLSTDAVQRYTQLEKDLSIESGVLTDAQKELNRSLGELALTGKGRASESLEALGLSMDTLKDKTPSEQMRILTESLSGVDNATERARIGQQLLGGAYEKIAPLLAYTTEEQSKLWDESKRGIGINSEQIAGYEKLDFMIQTVTSGIKTGISRAIGNLLPLVLKVIDRFKEFYRDSLRPIIDRLRELWDDIDHLVMPVLKGLGVFLKYTLKAAFKIIETQISIVATVITGLATGVETTVKTVQGWIENLVDWFTFLKDSVTGIFDNIRGVIDSVASPLSGIADTIGGITGGIGGFISKIPGLAAGGIVPATAGGRIVRVAEQGESEAVIPLGKLERLLANAGNSRNPNIEFTANLRIGPNQFASVFVDTYNQLKSQGRIS